MLTLALYMPRREDLESKHIRLRPVEEVLADPELWQMSYCQGLGGSTPSRRHSTGPVAAPTC